MIVPDQLYGLGPKALSGGLLELWSSRVGQSTTLATIQVNFPVIPLDRLLVLNTIYGRFLPGAAQKFVRARVEDVDAAGVIVGTIWGGAAVSGIVATQDYVTPAQVVAGHVISFGHRLALTADFDAGANANGVDFVISGWLIPKGEVQFAGNAP